TNEHKLRLGSFSYFSLEKKFAWVCTTEKKNKRTEKLLVPNVTYYTLLYQSKDLPMESSIKLKRSSLTNIKDKAKVYFNDSPSLFKRISITFPTMPILNWLLKYSCRENFVNDLIAGIIVGIMSIPQGINF
uniref:Uncharacterized protein n=1 Tax=Romanomermis culicivorax TaxID=13658 RepID=A0A915J0K6_ROMCU